MRLYPYWSIFCISSVHDWCSERSCGPEDNAYDPCCRSSSGRALASIGAFRGKAGNLKEGYGFLESNLKRITLVVGLVLYLSYFLAAWIFCGNYSYLHIHALCFWCRRPSKNNNWCHRYGFCYAMVIHGYYELNDPSGVLVDTSIHNFDWRDNFKWFLPILLVGLQPF